MAYCTENDLLTLISREELAELTAESGDTPDSQVVAAAISRAEGEIDALAGKRYAVPLSPVTAQIKGVAMDLALYHLYARRNLAPPVRRQKYEAALQFLQQVARGEAVLEGVSGSVPEGEQVESTFSGPVRVFTRSTLGDW
jgi:phage gp36-like protein